MASAVDASGFLLYSSSAASSSSSVINRWTRRFCLLSASRMQLFMSQQPPPALIAHLSSSPAASSSALDLDSLLTSSSSCSCLHLESSFLYLASYSPRPLTFELCAPTCAAFFSASSTADLQRWLTALIAAGCTAKAPTRQLTLFTCPPSSLLLSSLRLSPAYGKHGFLHKRASLTPAYQRRFFRTVYSASSAAVLHYTADIWSAGGGGSIDLAGCSVDVMRGGGAGEFSLSSDNRVYFLRADSESERDDWMRVLLLLGATKAEQAEQRLRRAEDLYARLGCSDSSDEAELEQHYREGRRRLDGGERWQRRRRGSSPQT